MEDVNIFRQITPQEHDRISGKVPFVCPYCQKLLRTYLTRIVCDGCGRVISDSTKEMSDNT